MAGKCRFAYRSNASAIAIVASVASVFLAPTAASACSWEPIAGGVSVVCLPAEPAVEPFQTSYSDGSDGYSGNGSDRLDISGGSIETGGDPLRYQWGPGVEDYYELDQSTAEVNLLGGDDVVTMSGGAIGTATAPLNLNLGDGNNSFTSSGGSIHGSLISADDNDTIVIGGGTIIDGSVFTNGGTDDVTVKDGARIGEGVEDDAVGLGAGNDHFVMTGGTLGGGLSTGADNDNVELRGGSIATYVNLEGGDDQILVTGNTSIGGDLHGDLGNDTITVESGSIGGYLSADDGDDTVILRGGTIGSAALSSGVTLDAGTDTLNMSGGTIWGGVYGGDGDDTVTISGGTINADTSTSEAGFEVLVAGPEPAVSGGEGYDSVSVTGGTVNGDIDAEHVELHGGTINGDVTGLGPLTLVIDNVGAVDPLTLRDGVVFSGTNANAQITDEDLAAGGSRRQNFVGFNNVALSNSTLAFAPGSNQQIAQLALNNGSTLFATGNAAMTGTVNAVSSTVSLIDGAANGVFTVGGLVLNNATIGLDLNQQTHQADQLVAGLFSATGNNIININLVGVPDFSGVTDIPIIVSSSGPVAGTFTITGIPGTVSSLFAFEVLPGAGGGLFIRATPTNFGIVTAPDSAVNGSIVDVAVDALYGINRDALDSDLGLAHGMAKVAITPSFGVFASGQFAHTDHDGYDVYSGSSHGVGPSFDAEDFSAAISLDFNAAKHFQLDTQYGLNFGLFAGYASTDVDLNPFLGFMNIGSGSNESGMFGGYALFRKSTTYALVSAATFLGKSEIHNGLLNSTGEYDTTGYAVTGSVGRIFMLSDRTRFDLRGGVLGVSFTGDGYTDSVGNVFGDSRISFGALQFAPGIYGDYKLSNDMMFSPYARLELQQRFGASNTTRIGSNEIRFEDADLSAALSGGFNLKMTDTTTLSGEVRGKWSADSSTIGGKIGLKVAF